MRGFGRGGAPRPAVESMEMASRGELGCRRRCPRLRRRRSKNAAVAAARPRQRATRERGWWRQGRPWACAGYSCLKFRPSTLFRPSLQAP